MDVRYALRALRRSPSYAGIAVLTLAIGIGATTTVMSVVDHVVLHTLPFRDADRLVMLLESGDKGGFRPPSAPTSLDWQRDPAARQAFDGISFVRGDGVVLAHGDAQQRVGAAYVGPEFFPLIGARPALGRMLIDDDHKPDAPPVAVISYEFWQRSMGGDRSILGTHVAIDSVPTTIVGVMPRGGQYPGFASVWQPLSHYKRPEVLTRRGLHADSRTIARLRSGVDSARAVAIMRSVSQRLALAYPAEQEHWGPAMLTVRDEILGGIAPTLFTLAAAAAGILLLACANVAGLSLARATSRSRELAVRVALGASRGRIVRQLLIESAVLSALGGVLGTLIAMFGVGIARSLPPDKLPRVEELSVDGRVLIVAAVATATTAIVCGLWPALRASRPESLAGLRGGGSGSIGVRADARLRRALVVAQFAMALVLVVGAGLLLQSLRRVLTVDVGFDPHGVVAVQINPPAGAYDDPAQAAALYQRLVQSVNSAPGVTQAAFINHVPFGRAAITSPIEIEGVSADTASRQVFYRTVSASYLETMKLSMRSGRWFTDADVRSPGGSFVINATLAKTYWPGESAIGKRITVRRSSQARADFGKPLTGVIVGVINDVRQVSQDALPQPEVYVPYTLETWPWGNIVARTRDGERSVPALRAAINAVDPRLIERGASGDQRFNVLEHAMTTAVAPRKLAMSLVSVFAACALLLAAIGMYGVVSYGIAQRTRELGVRKALGATDGMIAALVMRESMTLTGLGVLFGVAGAWAGARLIRGLLYETGAADPVTYASTIIVLGVVAAIATWAPARRATRLDPTIAMRGE